MNGGGAVGHVLTLFIIGEFYLLTMASLWNPKKPKLCLRNIHLYKRFRIIQIIAL